MDVGKGGTGGGGATSRMEGLGPNLGPPLLPSLTCGDITCK